MKRYKPFGKDNIREAAALQYDADKDRAPRVTALGRGYLAEQMVKEAERSHVQVVEDEKLCHVLHRMNAGDEIPEALYQVVAEILVFVYQADKQAGLTGRK